MKPGAKRTIHSTGKELNCMCCSWLASRSQSKPLSYTSEEKKEARRYQLIVHAGRQGEGLLCGTEGWKTKQTLGGG